MPRYVLDHFDEANDHLQLVELKNGEYLRAAQSSSDGFLALSNATSNLDVRHSNVTDDDMDLGADTPDGVERRGNDRRGDGDRRKEDLGPPGDTERRKSERRRGERRTK
jgi:hypothetical protein